MIYQYIKVKNSLNILISCAFLIELLLLVLSPIAIIGELQVRSLFCFVAMLIMSWYLNIQLIIKLSNWKKTANTVPNKYFVWLSICLIFVFISFFIWLKILKKSKAKFIFNKLKCSQVKNKFITYNVLYCIFLFYTWIIVAIMLSPPSFIPIPSSLIPILGMTVLPCGIIALGFTFYLLTNFKKIITNYDTKLNPHIYYELIWLTFFFPPILIWLLIYVNQNIVYSDDTSTKTLSRFSNTETVIDK